MPFTALESVHDVVDEDGHVSPAGLEVTAYFEMTGPPVFVGAVHVRKIERSPG